MASLDKYPRDGVDPRLFEELEASRAVFEVLENVCEIQDPREFEEVIFSEIERQDGFKRRIQLELAETIVNNVHGFVKGMDHVRGVETDLAWALQYCAEARKSLAAFHKKSVSSGFSIVKNYRRVVRCREIWNLGIGAEMIRFEEKKFAIALKAKDWPAVVLALRNVDQIIERDRRIQGLNAVKGSLNRIDASFLTVMHGICRSLAQICLQFSKVQAKKQLEHLAEVWEYFALFTNSSAETEELRSNLLSSFILEIDHLSLQSVLQVSEAAINLDLTESEPMRLFQLLGQRTSGRSYLPKTFKALGRALVKFLDGCSSLLEYVENFKTSKQAMKELIIVLDSLREPIWERMQSLVDVLLEFHKTGSSLKTEGVLTVLQQGYTLMSIGDIFCRKSEENILVGAKLRDALHSKCVEFFEHFRKERIEFLKQSIQNDLWSLLPLPSDFKVLDIVEFHMSAFQVNAPDAKNVDQNSFEKQSFVHMFDMSTNDLQADLEVWTAVEQQFMPKIPFLLSSSAMAVLRTFAAQCNVVRVLHPVRDIAFESLLELFDLYCYALFTGMGILTHSFFTTNSKITVRLRYPRLHKLVNEFRNKIREGTLSAGSFCEGDELPSSSPPLVGAPSSSGLTASPKPLISFNELAQDSFSQLSSCFGLAMRAVGCESLKTVASIFSWAIPAVCSCLSKDRQVRLDRAVKNIKGVAKEFKVYILRNISAQMLGVEIVVSQITSIDWKSDSVHSGLYRPYVDAFVEDIISIRSKAERALDGSNLPASILTDFMTECLSYAFERLLDAYSSVIDVKPACELR